MDAHTLQLEQPLLTATGINERRSKTATKKSQQPTFKKLSKLGNLQVTISSSMFAGERIYFPPKTRTKEKMSTPTTSIQHYTGDVGECD